jgi:hypothetical protein
VRAVLEALLITGAAMWAVLALSVLWVRHRLRRRLRIDPKVRSQAPTVWIWSPAPAARLHRRLRAVAATARAIPAADGSLAQIAVDLTGGAVALEPSLIAVARARRTGRPARRELSAQVSDLEATARRLTALSAQRSDPGRAAQLRERVDALEAAHAELAEIDVRAGLLRHA